MKTCNICKVSKNPSDYYKDNRAKDGLYARCKNCHNDPKFRFSSWRKLSENFKNEPQPLSVARYFINVINVRLLCYKKVYGHVKCKVSTEDLRLFFEDNWKEFLRQHGDWVKSDYDRRMKPTLDRIDSKGHYEIENIRILPLKINCGLANLGRKQTKQHIKKRITSRKNKRTELTNTQQP